MKIYKDYSENPLSIGSLSLILDLRVHFFLVRKSSVIEFHIDVTVCIIPMDLLPKMLMIHFRHIKIHINICFGLELISVVISF